MRIEKDIILDTRTKLNWLEGPDKELSWNEGEIWLSQLGGNWRFPTIPELTEIYDRFSTRIGSPTKSSNGLLMSGIGLGLDPEFKLSKAYSVWANSFDQTSAWMFGFTTGMAFKKPKNHSLEMYRVFAVSNEELNKMQRQ